jgi:hypothetical protein
MEMPKTELVPCHDCGRAIASTAAACPHCGSLEPGGPHVFSAEEGLRLGEHARNVRTMIATMVACGIAGASYGLLSSGTFADAIVASLVGFLVGGPIGFAIMVATRIIRE